MATQIPVVRVGVAALIKSATAEGNKLVVSVRKGSGHGVGHWQFPGGHLEFGETPLRCAERETLEETGLVVRAERVVAVTNDVFAESGKHYITLFVLCWRVSEDQEPQTLEPEKCEGWSWKTWDEIKLLGNSSGESGGSDGDVDGVGRQQRLFLPIINLLREYPNIQDLV